MPQNVHGDCSFFGSHEEREMMQLYQKMREFVSFLSASTPVEVALFLRSLPIEVVETLLREGGITVEDLSRYIEQHGQLNPNGAPLPSQSHRGLTTF